MQLTIQKTALSRALSEANAALASRSTLPILGNVLIETCEGQLRITATDLDLIIVAHCPAAIDKDGSTTLPAKRLQALVAQMPREEIHIEAARDSVTLTSGGAKFKILSLPATEFPLGNDMGDTTEIELSGAELSDSLRRIYYAASTDESRYVLNGVLCEIGGDEIRLIATDGRRLAKQVIRQKSGDTDRSLIIPNKAVAQLMRMAGDTETITLAIGENTLLASTPTASLRTRLIEGNFPNWQQVLPHGDSMPVTVSREGFLAAVKRVGLFTNEKANSIKFEFRAGQVEITSSSPEVGNASETVESTYTGENITTALNPEFVRGCLNALKTDDVTLELRTAEMPVCVTAQDFQYIIMPMRLAN